MAWTDCRSGPLKWNVTSVGSSFGGAGCACEWEALLLLANEGTCSLIVGNNQKGGPLLRDLGEPNH